MTCKDLSLGGQRFPLLAVTGALVAQTGRSMAETGELLRYGGTLSVWTRYWRVALCLRHMVLYQSHLLHRKLDRRYNVHHHNPIHPLHHFLDRQHSSHSYNSFHYKAHGKRALRCADSGLCLAWRLSCNVPKEQRRHYPEQQHGSDSAPKAALSSVTVDQRNNAHCC